MITTKLGFLRKNDIFIFKGKKYKVGSLIEGTNGYVACADVDTKKVKRLYIYTTIEVEQ